MQSKHGLAWLWEKKRTNVRSVQISFLNGGVNLSAGMRVQKGFTITETTINTIRSVGTSFISR